MTLDLDLKSKTGLLELVAFGVLKVLRLVLVLEVISVFWEN